MSAKYIIMKNLIRLKEDKNGKLLPCLPSGEFIPSIAKGTLSMNFSPDLTESGLYLIKMEVYANIEDLKEVDLSKCTGSIKGHL